jgi:hypothetical protein
MFAEKKQKKGFSMKFMHRDYAEAV